MNIKEIVKLTAIGILVVIIIGVISVSLLMSFCSTMYAHIFHANSVNNSTIGLIFVFMAFYILIRNRYSTDEYRKNPESMFSW
jgi:hypothetical protein